MPEPWGEILGITAFAAVIAALHFIGKALRKIFPSLAKKKTHVQKEADEYYGIPW